MEGPERTAAMSVRPWKEGGQARGASRAYIRPTALSPAEHCEEKSEGEALHLPLWRRSAMPAMCRAWQATGSPPWGGEAPSNCQTGERRQIDDRGHGAADISPAALSYPPCKQAGRPAIDAPGDASGCAHYPAQVLGVVAVQVTLHEGMQVECTRVLRIKTGEHALPVPVLRPAYETHVDAMP